MRLRLLRLRFRRRFHIGQRQVGNLGSQTEKNFDRHFVKRLNNLTPPVRRFVAAWVLLLVLLIGALFVQNIALSGYYQQLRPVPGGIYNEGMLGTFTNANPLYAASDVDTSISKLLFSGLFTYDNHNKLVGDLARSYSVDRTGTVYTVRLKPNLTWQDGQPLTSTDVLFTYQTIQDPDAQSPLRDSWQNITVSAPDSRTVVFKLPGTLASFPYTMTNGIVPKHILEHVPAAGLRSADFNTVHPVGAGPFAWQAIQVSGNDPSVAEEQIALVPFDNYGRGAPKLREFIVHVYASSAQLTAAFKSGQLTGAAGLSSVPDSIKGMDSLDAHSPLLTAENMVFFKTSSGLLSDVNVRQALVEGTDRQAIIKSLGYPTHSVREPFLMGQLGYNPSLAQAGFNLPAAKKLLDKDGWKTGKDGIRSKAGQKLSFTLTAADNPEYRSVTDQLRDQWKKLGVDLKVALEEKTDFQNALTYHNYDAVLYGISIGPDPDVLVYWDSSQADARSSTRLNLSEYKNVIADSSLEAGRSRLDPGLRVVKYKPFLEEWQKDYPALGLYQPRYLYLTNGPVAGLSDNAINSAAGRFDNVQNWEIREARVTD
ncbi:MAG TPA: ABC transporter substrate-binding protein [Candidatus Saccharimonadales bacterium]|nr:ABC transporter substrate-binding protein [Candidatus Saccharimonadales bacterium]